MPNDPSTPSKAERRQRAKAEKEAARKRAERKRKILRGALSLAAAVVIMGAVLFLLKPHESATATSGPTPVLASSPGPNPDSLPGMQTGPPPWDANTSDLLARLDAIGLSATPMEGTALHIHQHLEILVDGKPVEVPAQIGIASGGSAFSPIHTHTPDGIIHVESSAPRVFTLGQFFDVWGVPFTKTCLGPYCNAGTKTLTVFVNGHRVTGDPSLVELTEHQEVVVAYGTPDQLPSSIPATYSFPQGL